MTDRFPYEIIGPAVGGLRPFSVEVPRNSAICLGIPEWVPTLSTREQIRRISMTHCRLDVLWSDTPTPVVGNGKADNIRFHSDLYPGELGIAEALTVWVVRQRSQALACPPEWENVTQPYRFVLRTHPPGTTQFDSQFWYRIVCSPIPDDEIDPDRLGRAQLYWTEPDGFANAVNPPCRPDRVASLITELAQLVPDGYAHSTSGPVPQPSPTKYPDELETYFAAMEHHGLTGRTHLFPAAGPIDRDDAIAIRAALNGRERTNAGRIGRSPSSRRFWVTGLFPITARGHWGLAVDVSTADTRGSVWSYFGGEDTLMHEFDSLCDFLAAAVGAYRESTTLQGYHLDIADGAPRWLIPDRDSGALLPEPRDLGALGNDDAATLVVGMPPEMPPGEGDPDFYYRIVTRLLPSHFEQALRDSGVEWRAEPEFRGEYLIYRGARLNTNDSRSAATPGHIALRFAVPVEAALTALAQLGTEQDLWYFREFEDKLRPHHGRLSGEAFEDLLRRAFKDRAASLASSLVSTREAIGGMRVSADHELTSFDIIFEPDLSFNTQAHFDGVQWGPISDLLADDPGGGQV